MKDYQVLLFLLVCYCKNSFDIQSSTTLSPKLYKSGCVLSKQTNKLINVCESNVYKADSISFRLYIQ